MLTAYVGASQQASLVINGSSVCLWVTCLIEPFMGFPSLPFKSCRGDREMGPFSLTTVHICPRGLRLGEFPAYFRAK